MYNISFSVNGARAACMATAGIIKITAGIKSMNVYMGGGLICGIAYIWNCVSVSEHDGLTHEEGAGIRAGLIFEG